MPCRCPICMDDISFSSTVIATRSLSVTPCGHLYHEPCIKQWFTKTTGEAKKQCPLCRKSCTVAKLVRLFADFYVPDARSGQLDSQAVDTARQELLDKLAELQVKYQKASELERQSNAEVVAHMEKSEKLAKSLRKAEGDAKIWKKNLESTTAECDKAKYDLRMYRREADELLAEQGKLKEEARRLKKAAMFFEGTEDVVEQMLSADDDGLNRESYKILLLQAKRNMDAAVSSAQLLTRNNTILTKQINDARDLGLEKQRAVTSLEQLLNRERAESAKLKAKLDVVLSANQKSGGKKPSSSQELLSDAVAGAAEFDDASADDDTYRSRMKALIESTTAENPTPESVKAHPAMQRLRQEYPPPRISLDCLSSIPEQQEMAAEVDQIADDNELEILNQQPKAAHSNMAPLMRLPALNKTRQVSMISHMKPSTSSSGILRGGISKPKLTVGGGNAKTTKTVGRNANLLEMLYNKTSAKAESSSTSTLRSMKNVADDRRKQLRRQKTSFNDDNNNGSDDEFAAAGSNAGIVARSKQPTLTRPTASAGQRFHPSMFGLPTPLARIPAAAQSSTRALKSHPSESDVIVID